MCHITLNKIPIFDDNGTITPGGVRIGRWIYDMLVGPISLSCLVFTLVFRLMEQWCIAGTPAMTTRGCLESDFEIIADYLLKAAQIASMIQRGHGKLQKAFLKGLQSNKEIVELRTRVEAFASQFAMPGFDFWMVLLVWGWLSFSSIKPFMTCLKLRIWLFMCGSGGTDINFARCCLFHCGKEQNIEEFFVYLGKVEVFVPHAWGSGNLEICVGQLRAFGRLWSLFPWTLDREQGIPSFTVDALQHCTHCLRWGLHCEWIVYINVSSLRSCCCPMPAEEEQYTGIFLLMYRLPASNVLNKLIE